MFWWMVVDLDIFLGYLYVVQVQFGIDCIKIDIGWEVDVIGFLDFFKDFYVCYLLLDVYIIENGVCYNDELVDGVVNDQCWVGYLEQYFFVIVYVLEDGVLLKGYFFWSFMDNFEWVEGYKMCFGIVYVDYDIQVWILKDSVYWYKDLVVVYDLDQ